MKIKKSIIIIPYRHFINDIKNVVRDYKLAEKKMKLSKTQKRVLEKLTDRWQNSYELQESRNTLNSLTRLGLVERKYETGAGFLPRTCIVYRKKNIKDKE